MTKLSESDKLKILVEKINSSKTVLTRENGSRREVSDSTGEDTKEENSTKDMLSEEPQVRFLSVPNIPQIRAVIGAGVRNAFPRHAHETFSIGVITEGTRTMSLRGELFCIPKNGLYCINPGEAHSCSPGTRDGHSYQALCIESEFMQWTISKFTGKNCVIPHFATPLLVNESASAGVRRFVELLEQTAFSLDQRIVLADMLFKLVLQHTTMSLQQSLEIYKNKESIQRACDCIHSNYADPISLDQISRFAGMSPFHLHRLFYKAKGMTPHDYLLKIRLTHALDMLLQGNSQADCAHVNGFSDQSHFSRTFKKMIGITPGRFVSDNNIDSR